VRLERGSAEDPALQQTPRPIVAHTTNLASFANAFAREAGLHGWKVEPFEKLPGGRVIIALGGEPPAPELFAALLPTLAAAGAAPVDALLYVPPQMVETRADCGKFPRLGCVR